MRAAAIGLLVAACSSPPATPPPIAHHVAVETPKPVEQKVLVDRHLSVGSRQPAMRGSWELTIDGNRATLVEIAQTADGLFTMERVDRDAKWTTTETHVETGPAHQVGDHLALDFEAKGDALFLRCWHRQLKVATAGARRVKTPGHITDCSDPGVWSPATLTRVDALVCGFGDGLDDGQVSGMDGSVDGSIDETLSRFVAAPGIEFVEVNEDCFQSAGLRLAK